MPPATSTRRTQLTDVAAAAGVSLATVDRVLHRRPGVRPSTVEQVLAAIQRLDYRTDPAATRLARAHTLQAVAIVLPKGSNSFVATLAEEVLALGPWLTEQRLVATVQRVDVFAPELFARHLVALRRRFAAVFVMGVDHPLVRAAIDDLCSDGTTVITLVSDVPSSRRAHYVGIDNVAAGRSAAALLGRFLGPDPKRVGVVLGSLALRDHAERLFGFQQVMASDHPNITLLPALEGHDNSDTTRQQVAELLKRDKKLGGLYSIGGGNRGIQTALTDSKRAAKVVWVCHELTTHTRRALLDGVADAVINQDPGHELRSAFRLALARLNKERVVPGQERIRIDIFVKENLP